MARVGRPRADDGKVINGILHMLTTGCRWMRAYLRGRGIRANISANPRNRHRGHMGLRGKPISV